MANPNQSQSSEPKNAYVCVFNITQPHPDLGDPTKELPSRCIHVPPGTTVHLTAREAEHLLKKGAIRRLQ